MVALAVWGMAACAAGAQQSMRLRIAWGGGSEKAWQGRIALTEGVLSDPVPLGLEADEAGVLVLEPEEPKPPSGPGGRPPQSSPRQPAGGHLAVRPRGPRSYDGLDLSVTAPAEASLWVELAAADDRHQPARIEIPLADLLQGSFETDLDEQGNRLIVRRAPGDHLRVKLARRSLVFGPGEVLRCEVQPHLLPVAAGTRLRLKAQLLAGRSERELWSEEHAWVAGQAGGIPLEVPLGRDEGVFDLLITVHHASKLPWPQQVRSPLSLKQQPIAERTVQLIVLSGQPLSAMAVPGSRLGVVEEIEPDGAKGRLGLIARLPKLPRLPWSAKGSWGSGHAQTVPHALGPVVRLAPNRQAGEPSWEAYALSISRPGEPHVLEVEYPSDVPQTLGISIIEPNAAGAVLPIGLDSGIDRAEEIGVPDSLPQWLRHRLVFWPRTKSPILLMTNRRETAPAAYGKIRVLAGWVQLPRAFAPTPKPERLLAAYMARPLVAENFCATEALGAPGEQCADDWLTFYEGGSRLVQYLHHVGYNGLMLSVFADGSTIYPSSVVAPTPRYDTGAYFASGQDPVRKDVLEMLLRLFDREGLQLIPTVEFATPLPELEAVLCRGGDPAVGIQWIGPDGQSWLQTHAPRKGKAPYYNPLHPRVQEAMLSVIRELASTYGQHPAFGGLAVQLSASGYAQLPGPEWGLDDVTVALFEKDTNLRLPEGGPERFARRAEALSLPGPDGQRRWRREWLQWRAGRLAEFYRRVHAELNAIRPGTRLYLAGGEMLSGEALVQRLRPSLPRTATLADTLLWLGIDARQFEQNEAIVLLRPERIAPRWSLPAEAVSLEIEQLPDLDRYFQPLPLPGSLFYHPPQEARLASFDEKCPLRPCYTWLATQAVPSAWQNRRRFAHSLATLDPQVLCDGGWLLPMGQEESLRYLIAAFRRLPAIRMERVAEPVGPAAGQPVTIRSGSRADRTYVYLVNDAAFPVAVRLRVEAPSGCRLEELTGLRPIEPLKRDAQGAYWDVELGPYDLIAACFWAPTVRLYGPEVAMPPEVHTALDRQVRELGFRVAALRTPPLLEVLENPGFDRPPGPQGQIAGWIRVQPAGVTIQLDSTTKYSGSAAVRLASTGPAGGLVSPPFAPPASGRLAMLARMRVADPARQPPVRLVVEARQAGRTLTHYAQFGQAAGPQTEVQPISTQWSPYLLEVVDLPLEGLSAVRVRLELAGPGEVWIDDVQLCDLAFNKRELTELLRVITPVDAKRQNGEVADCIRMLEGYWPRLLAERVRLSEAQLAGGVQRGPAEQPLPDQPDRSTSLLDRLKSLVPGPLRF
ncbi:MAG: family 10 glycosylhydrolase [Thermoguttaceae bacterium]